MIGDKKGKGKQVVQQKKNALVRIERESVLRQL